MSSTLVALTDIYIADRSARRKILGFRSSHGNIDAYNQTTIQLARGETQEFDVKNFFYCYIRDVLTVQITDSTNNTVTFPEAVGSFSLSSISGKITLSVPSDSTISLERVIHVVYS